MLPTANPERTQILALIIQGEINRQIAKQLNITIRTVEIHRSHIMENMQAESLAELIAKISLLK
ncbi:LuxR C-terminal-related transcriptional regulator [Rodentibacter haemolyticus]|uniref:LuxR C-terminal-related transcriptional regulator n=1 Tax=Rodentibacter haemolyticus TaxID=2778911 RepID=UPI001E60A03B|nr:LuxR C-terminal-related transcriptional regulator [Rodentibacter haemolyticus]